MERIVILLLICSTVACGHNLYFPMTNVEFTLPLTLPPSTPILKIQALRKNDSYFTDTCFTLSIEPSRAIEFFTADARSGDLLFSALPGLESTKLLEHTPEVKVEVTARNASDVTPEVMLINGTLRKNESCYKIAEDVCFWRRASYQVFENRQAAILGSLGPAYFAALCPGHTLTYTMLEGGEYAGVHSALGEWTLWSRPGLDREVGGSEVTLKVKCSITETGIPSPRHFQKEMTLRIRDENDNPPHPLQDTVDIFLDNPYVTKGQRLDIGNLVFKDNDFSLGMDYDVSLLGDTHALLYAHCFVTGDSKKGPQHSIITCKLRARKTGHLVLPTPYVVHLKVIDPGMVQGHGPAHGTITIRLHADNSPPLPPLALPLTSHPAVVYPSEVSILRSAAPYGRVAQPRDSPAGDLRFSLNTSDNHIWKAHLFNVTAVGGIVFVNNVKKLKHSPTNMSVTLTIVWHVPGLLSSRQTADIRISILDGPTTRPCNATTDRQMNAHSWPFCSEMEEWKSCESLCGLGTSGGRGCQWRGQRKLEPPFYLTTNYSTCTPDIATCPDRHCDPLEELQPLLCPQDCTTTPALLAVDPSPKRNGSRGIYMASGVCICDRRASCNCVAPNQKKHPKTNSKNGHDVTNSTLGSEVDNMTLNQNETILVYPNLKKEASAVGESRTDVSSAGIASDDRLCGATCLVAVLAIGCFLVLTSVGGSIYWTWRKSAKGRRERKFVGSVASLSGVPSDYARSLQGSQLLSYDPAAIPTAPFDPRSLPDPKWEFNRNQLVIEQTLGEGEFGRVLRARATNISGYTGVTTVAVKTLKEDASSVELADLLSEYQLLKEVSHPNVIKLLGACTQPSSQPVYIIIEFALHGSLRNYLRKSRHLESDGRIPCSFGASSSLAGPSSSLGDIEEPITSPCTPRDILSFAWQIAKGMAYLSDIKLVHRDLAARNVLVAAGGVCKVSDFGLTRDIYEDDAYLKRSKGRVPVKWMALESLADHMYTSKSDVWSYGVLMWELVTLGASPYPGVAVHNLFHLLKAGYRMEKPENCSNHLYEVMQGCWQESPCDRPSFHDLTLIFERMLEDGVEYLDLNPRIVHNRTYFTSPAEPAHMWTNPLLYNTARQQPEDHNPSASGQQDGGNNNNRENVQDSSSSPNKLIKYSTISRSATQLLQNVDNGGSDVRLNSPITPETLQLFHYSTICGPGSPESDVKTPGTQALLPNSRVSSRFQENSTDDTQQLLPCSQSGQVDSPQKQEPLGEDPSQWGDRNIHSYENDADVDKKVINNNNSYLSPIRKVDRTQNASGYSYVSMVTGSDGGGNTHQDMLSSVPEVLTSSPHTTKVTRF